MYRNNGLPRFADAKNAGAISGWVGGLATHELPDRHGRQLHNARHVLDTLRVLAPARPNGTPGPAGMRFSYSINEDLPCYLLHDLHCADKVMILKGSGECVCLHSRTESLLKVSHQC